MVDELEQRRKHNQMMRDRIIGVRDRIIGVSAQEGSTELDGVSVNLPFERVPQHAADPGFGPVPPVEEDYWVKAYRLADELRRHLMTRPVT